jgi:hypothetical protein
MFTPAVLEIASIFLRQGAENNKAVASTASHGFVGFLAGKASGCSIDLQDSSVAGRSEALLDPASPYYLITLERSGDLGSKSVGMIGRISADIADIFSGEFVSAFH